MIRAILALLFAVLYLILGIPVLFVEWIIRKCNRHAADISSLRMVQWAFRVIMFICGVKLTVIGEENVPKDVPVLYIGNHRSYFDIIITYSRCPRLTGYIAKDTMGKVPLLNIWMKRLYCLFLDRTDMKKGLKTILTGKMCIRDSCYSLLLSDSDISVPMQISLTDNLSLLYQRPVFPAVPLSYPSRNPPDGYEAVLLLFHPASVSLPLPAGKRFHHVLPFR